MALTVRNNDRLATMMWQIPAGSNTAGIGKLRWLDAPGVDQELPATIDPDGDVSSFGRTVIKGRIIMTPGHETLIITAFAMIGLLSILTFSMVARYRKAHNDHVESSAEQAA